MESRNMTIQEEDQILMAELIAAQVFDYEYDEDKGEVQPSEDVCNEIGRRAVARIMQEWSFEGFVPAECDHERTRMDDGISSCLDCGDRLDTDADDDDVCEHFNMPNGKPGETIECPDCKGKATLQLRNNANYYYFRNV